MSMLKYVLKYDPEIHEVVKINRQEKTDIQ